MSKPTFAMILREMTAKTSTVLLLLVHQNAQVLVVITN
jgi:hypothetical protein